MSRDAGRDGNRETAPGVAQDEEIEMGSIALAIASGFATFLIVGIGFTELAHQWLPVPLLVGLVVGATAGAVATASVTAGLTGGVPRRQRRLAGGFAGYTVGFVAGFVVASWVLGLGVVPSIALGVIVGFLVAGWGARQGTPASTDTEL